MVVATHQVPECARLMLSFLIDRPVPERISQGDFPDARWILEPAKARSRRVSDQAKSRALQVVGANRWTLTTR